MTPEQLIALARQALADPDATLPDPETSGELAPVAELLGELIDTNRKLTDDRQEAIGVEQPVEWFIASVGVHERCRNRHHRSTHRRVGCAQEGQTDEFGASGRGDGGVENQRGGCRLGEGTETWSCRVEGGRIDRAALRVENGLLGISRDLISEPSDHA